MCWLCDDSVVDKVGLFIKAQLLNTKFITTSDDKQPLVVITPIK
jgi:hypothetical protein